MTYDLWDVEIGKYLGQFTEEDKALALVQTLIDRYGPEYAESLALGRRNDDGSILEPIVGHVLAASAERARRATSTRNRQPAFTGSRTGDQGKG